MNHKAIVVKQMNDEASKLRVRLAELEAGIRVLGGVSKAPTSPVQRRSRGKAAASPSRPRSSRKSPVNGELLPPALAAELAAIKANTALTPIQKAQASRKARFAASKAPVRPEGAVLGEAAAS